MFFLFVKKNKELRSFNYTRIAYITSKGEGPASSTGSVQPSLGSIQCENVVDWTQGNKQRRDGL